MPMPELETQAVCNVAVKRPSQKELAQAASELNAALIGKREFLRRAGELKVTAADRREQEDIAEGLEHTISWIRAHYAS